MPNLGTPWVMRLLLPALLATTAVGQAQAQSTASIQRQIEQLKEIIRQQQETIDSLQRQVQTVQGAQTQVQEQAQEASDKADQATKAMTEKPVVNSVEPKVKLGLAGQVNRMINFGADGKNTKAYFLDNDNSVSRFLFRGDARVADDLTISSNIEVAVAPNHSNQVSQKSEAITAGDTSNSNNLVELRKVEGIFASKKYGILFFGRGDPSTKDIARQDLSGTDVLAYANVANIAGGLNFVNRDTDAYTGPQIKNAFSDFDPSRQNRVDTIRPTSTALLHR